MRISANSILAKALNIHPTIWLLGTSLRVLKSSLNQLYDNFGVLGRSGFLKSTLIMPKRSLKIRTHKSILTYILQSPRWKLFVENLWKFVWKIQSVQFLKFSQIFKYSSLYIFIFSKFRCHFINLFRENTILFFETLFLSVYCKFEELRKTGYVR